MEKRLLLAAALSLAVLALWEFVSPKPQKPPAGRAAPATSVASVTSPGVPTALPANAEVSAAAAPARTEPMPAPVAGRAEERPTLENEVVRAVFSNRGAVLTSLLLLRHTDDQKKPLDLIRQMPLPAQKPLAVTFPGNAELTSRVGAALFAVERQGERALRFSYADDAVSVTKEVRFQNGYLFDGKVNVVRPPYVLTAGTGLRNTGPDELASRYIQPATAIAMTANGLARAHAEKLEKPPERPIWDKGFAGLEDNYFLEVLLPRQPATGVAFPVPLPLNAGGKPAATVGVGLTGRGELSARAYFGPKDVEILEGLQIGLEKTVDFGWYGILARPLLWLLKRTYGWVGNYGVAILLVTLAIRILLFPLMHKSYS